MSVTAVIKARDEAHQIARCIESARLLADEILVVDDHSTDGTAQLARDCGAVVISGEQHNGNINRLDRQGFACASGEWLLRMDADERLTPGLADRLRALTAVPDVDAVRYARRYYFMDGWLSHGGWFRSEHVGFFRASAWDRGWTGATHSQVPIAGRMVTLPAQVDACMLHYQYFSIEEYVTRSMLAYARREGVERAASRSEVRLRRLLWGPMRRGAGRYFVRGGFRDGARGAMAAALLGAYDVCVEAYAWQAMAGPWREPGVVPDGDHRPESTST